MTITGIIPARFGSSRLPGKPLRDLGGKPLIRQVWERCRKATSLDRLVVATDDRRILETVIEFGGEAVMTSTRHSTGTDRCRETAEILGLDSGVIINIQGDEPFIDPGYIDKVAK